jgi:hypothetical protein
VAHSLGRKVYVSKDKLAVLDCINLAPSYRALLTTNHLETNLHAVSTENLELHWLCLPLQHC